MEITNFPPKRMQTAAVVALSILSLFLLAKSIQAFKEIPRSGTGYNTISVSGKGEVLAVPDVVVFSYSVSEEGKTVKDAQKQATEKSNKALSFLKDQNIDEKDIKTTAYNVYPKYDYDTRALYPCSQYSCPPSKQIISGYEVSQSVEVRVRDTEKAGDILAGIGSLEVQNVSGLSFEVDDEDKLVREARQAAIKDAQDKAKALAKDLGVRLGKLVSFDDQNAGYPVPMYSAKAYDVGMGGGPTESIPEISLGEQKVVKNVNLVYEIR
jgi:hypothetical protein